MGFKLAESLSSAAQCQFYLMPSVMNQLFALQDSQRWDCDCRRGQLVNREASIFFAKEGECVFSILKLPDSVIRAGYGYKEQRIILVGIQSVVVNPTVCCAAVDMQFPLCQ